MMHVDVGRRYYIVLPVAADGAPDDAEINRALSRPDCALSFDVWRLEGQLVGVFVTGLLSGGGDRAALVGCEDGTVMVLPVAWLAAEYPQPGDLPKRPLA